MVQQLAFVSPLYLSLAAQRRSRSSLELESNTMKKTENSGLDFRGKAEERESDEVWEMVQVIGEAKAEAKAYEMLIRYDEARIRKSSAMDSGREGDVVGEMEWKLNQLNQIVDLLKKALTSTEKCKASIGTSLAMASWRTQIRVPEPDAKNLQLRLPSSLPDSFYTGNKAEGKFDSAIPVELIDKSTGHVVTSGPLSCAKLVVVAVDGNFDNEDDDDWTLEDFNRRVVTDRDGKKLLTGNLELSLKEGVGFLGEFTFADNTNWMQSRKIRIAVQVASGFCEGIRVREAKSNAFVVKDRRGEGRKKHDLPAPDDEVWRLRNIGKDGAFHKRLNEARIFKVRDFLWKLKLSRKELRKVLGTSMSNGKWETLVKHAETCDLSGKYYVYYDENNKSTGVIFEKIFELCGFTEGGVCYSAENIPVPKKDYADTLIGKACDNACGRWEHIVEYHRPMPSDMKPSKRARVSATHVVPGAPARSCHTDLRARRQDPPVPIVQQVPAPGRSPSDGHVREDPTFYSMEDPGGGTSDLFAWARDFLTDGEPAPDPELADGTSELAEGERDRLPPIDRTWEDILACAEANSGSDQLDSTVFGTPVASRDRALVNQMFDEHYGHFEDRYCMVGADIQGELRPRAPSNRSYIEGDIISESWLL